MSDPDSIKIIRAETSPHIESIRALFREYEAFLRVDLSFQDFENELSGLPGKYAPPRGDLLLAVVNHEPAGCVGVRELSGDICEMKRLYVRPAFKNMGLGRQLAREIIEVAADLGYLRMRLDTLETLENAMRLYLSLGFKKIDPYYHNPLKGVVYLEIPLK
jgi:ribosomal protein S18 acetylase RimI-like enzyme